MYKKLRIKVKYVLAVIMFVLVGAIGPNTFNVKAALGVVYYYIPFMPTVI